MLPKTVDPIRFAKQQATFDGDVALKTLPRLQEICDQVDKTVHVVLQFDQESRWYVIRGNINGSVGLICQRCNCPMDFNLDVSFVLSPVVSEERAKNLPTHIEPVFMEDESIVVDEMIEDEILLAFPMVPKHESDELLEHCV